MEPARIESLLESGWHLIGQLTEWLSAPPPDLSDRLRLFEIIRRLQHFWSKADDLNLRRIARNSLVLELFLERICAETLELTPLNGDDLASGINSLGILLRGFESTHVEPEFPDIDLLQRLECQSLQASWSQAQPARTIEIPAGVMVVAPAVSAGMPLPIVRLASERNQHLRLDENLQASPSYDLTQFATIEDFRASDTGYDDESSRRLLPGPPVRLRLPHHGQSIALPAPVVVDDSHPCHVENVRASFPETRKVLMVEASLFYRHLFGDVLRTAGYEAVAIEGLAGQLEAIESDADSSFCAIMIGLPAATEAAQIIQRIRHQLGIHLIGLLTTQDHRFSTVEVDACVLKSHPRHLLDVLERLHRPSLEPMLLTA